MSMENNRYARQIILPQIGVQGQEKLRNRCVSIIGAGALGNVSADLLARSGIGKIKIIDRDIVEITNLQRQFIFQEEDINKPKAEVVAEHIKKTNSEVQTEHYVTHLDYTNIEKILEGSALLIDATDNFETRFLLNDYSVKHKVPWLYCGVIATYGMTFNIEPQKGRPCLRCIFPKIPAPGTLPTCETAGILNTVPVLFGSLQVTEALKMLLDVNTRETLLIFDCWKPELQEITVSRAKDCEVCVKNKFEYLEGKHLKRMISLCGQNAYQIISSETTKPDISRVRERIGNISELQVIGEIIMFEVEGLSFTIFPDGRTIVKGVSSEEQARTAYSKYIGD